MPRNRKQSQKSRTASPEKHVRDVKGGFGMNELDDKWSDDIFTYVQEMFTGQVDPDVIHMVLSESEWRVEEAVDTLFHLVGNDKGQVGKSTNNLYELASTVLDNKENEHANPYLSNMAKSDGRLKAGMDSLDPIDIPLRQCIKSEEKPDGFAASEKLVSQRSNNDAFGKYGLCTFELPSAELDSTHSNPHSRHLSLHSQAITSDYEAGCTSSSGKTWIDPDGIIRTADPLVSADLYPLPSGRVLPNTVGTESLDNHVAVTSAQTLHMNLSKLSSPHVISETETMPFSHGADAISSTLQGAGINVDFPESRDFTTKDNCAKPAGQSRDISANILPKECSFSSGIPSLNSEEISNQQTRIPNCSVKFQSGMKVTGPSSLIETQKNEILKSVNCHNIQHQKLYLPTPGSVDCGTLSDMSVEEKRGSVYTSVLSADAPEFVPSWASPDLDQSAGALIKPWEMSVPGMSTSKLTYVNKAWPRPTERFSLSEAIKPTNKHKSSGSRQLSRKSNVSHVQREIIENYIKSGEKVLVLLRGCPGSGKSTLARQIKFDGTILTTDDFFMRGNFYDYDQGLVGDAHLWNQQRSEEAMKAGISPVIIDNTNSQRWEMKPYVAQALKYGYKIELMEPQTKWKYKARELCKRNSHNVGLESIQRMLQRFEYHITVEDIMNCTQTGKQHRSQGTESRGSKNLSGITDRSESEEGGKASENTSLNQGVVTKYPGLNQSVTLATNPGGEVYMVEEDSQGRALSADVIVESEEEIEISDDESNSTTSSREVPSVHSSSSKECLDSESGVSDELAMTSRFVSQHPEGSSTHSSHGPIAGNKVCIAEVTDRGFHLAMLPDKPPVIPLPQRDSLVTNTKPQVIPLTKIDNSVIETKPQDIPRPQRDSLVTNTKPQVIPLTKIDNSVIETKPQDIPLPQRDFLVTKRDGKSPPSHPTSIIPDHCNNGNKMSPEVAAFGGLGQVGVDILANVASELALITSQSDIDVVENEFKALIYCAPLSEKEKEEVEKRLTEAVKVRKLLHQGSAEAGQYVSTKDHCTAKSTSCSGTLLYEQEGETPEVKGSSVWDAPAPKPQRRPRVHSGSEDRMAKTGGEISQVDPVIRNTTRRDPADTSQLFTSVDQSFASQIRDETQQVGVDDAVDTSQLSTSVDQSLTSQVRDETRQVGVDDAVDTSQLSTSEDQSVAPQLGKSASKTHRKPRRKQARRPPSPLFDSAVKERFLSNTWSFPAFEACNSDSSEESGATTGMHHQVVTETPAKLERSSNTCPRDFNILHCVNEGYKASAIEDEFRLHSVQLREINAPHVAEERTLGRSGTLDRGTSTDDLQEEMNEKFGLEFLHSCFKDVPVEDLMDILASCANDVGDAVNILLDWGYDYIASPEQRKKIALHRLKSPDDHPVCMHSLLRLESSQNVMPLSLTDLCSQVVKARLSVSDRYIQELLISGSQKRLAVVEKVTMRCERLMSCEGGADSQHDVWVREGAVLCLYSDSENSDMAYSSDNEESATTEQESEGAVKGHWDSGPVPTVPSVSPATRTQVSKFKAGQRLVGNAESDTLDEEERFSEVDNEASGRAMTKTSAVLMHSGDTDPNVTSSSDVSTSAGSAGPAIATAPEPAGKAEAGSLESASGIDARCVSLNLSRKIIETLEGVFGPVNSGQDDQAVKSLDVDVDYSVARELYNCLKKAFSQKEDMVEQSNTAVYQVRGGDTHVHSQTRPAKSLPAPKRRRRALNLPSLRTSQRNVRTPHRAPVAPHNPSPWYREPVNFREILDEETAIQLSKEEHLRLMESSGDTAALSTRLKRQKLQSMFPGVNDAMIDEFFEANRFSLEESRLALQSVLGTSAAPKTVLSAELAHHRENQEIDMAVRNSLLDLQPKKSLPLIVTSEPATELEPNLDYQDFRAEAFTHHKLRKECFQKAQDAYRRGMKDVASFYSQEGHLHSEKLREANHRASQRILYHRNADLDNATTIDLHGLHPAEAVRHLAHILKERQQDLRQTSGRQRCHLTVIVGRGTHSRGGRAKLYPAVVDFLTKTSYSWSQQGSGVVQIVLRG